jgi:hypothetical protein
LKKTTGPDKGVHSTFCNPVKYPENMKEQTEKINRIEISIYFVEYDETE